VAYDSDLLKSNSAESLETDQRLGTAEDADALYAEGMAHYRRREWEDARRCFARLKSIAPGRRGVDALLNEVDIFIQLQDMQPEREAVSFDVGTAQGSPRAEPVVEQAVEAKTGSLRRSARPVVLVGVVAVIIIFLTLYATGMLDSVTGNQRQTRVRALLNHGRAALTVGDCNRAVEAFGEALALAPTDEDVQIWYLKAQTCQQLASLYAQAEEAIAAEQWATAMEKLGEIVAIDLTYKDASEQMEVVQGLLTLEDLLTQAESYFEQGAWNEAIQTLEQLQQQAPAFKPGEVQQFLFLAHFRSGIDLLAAADDSPELIMQAIQNFDLALAIFPDDQTALAEKQLADLYRQAYLAFNQENWPQAVLVLRQIYDSRPDYMGGRATALLCTSYVQLGDAYQAAGDLEQALDQYTNVLAIERCDHVEAAVREREVRDILYPPTPTPTSTPRATPTPLPTPTRTSTPSPPPVPPTSPPRPTSPPQPTPRPTR
jgi:tetratricopeptide (TPR) repeat protein